MSCSARVAARRLGHRVCRPCLAGLPNRSLSAFDASAHFSGLCCLSRGITDLSLLGIVSLPWSPLASLPPDVEVPLPLLSGAMPVVSLGFFELAESAAGRGVPGLPALLWAYAMAPDITNAVVKAIAVIFMAKQASAGIRGSIKYPATRSKLADAFGIGGDPAPAAATNESSGLDDDECSVRSARRRVILRKNRGPDRRLSAIPAR
jgi:hypothetical protein